MRYEKASRGGDRYVVIIHRTSDDGPVMARIEFRADVSGLGGALRSIDTALNEAHVSKALGLRRKRRKAKSRSSEKETE